MGSSLRDIPGAGGGRRRGRLGKVAGGPASKPWQPPPRAGPGGRSKAKGRALRFQAPRVRVDRFNLVLALAFLGLFVFAIAWLLRVNQVEVSTVGLQDGGAVRTREVADLVIELRIDPAGRAESATVTFEGADVTEDLEAIDGGFRWVPPEEGLEEGTYELGLEVSRPVFGTESWTMTFRVDDTASSVDASTPTAPSTAASTPTAP